MNTAEYQDSREVGGHDSLRGPGRRARLCSPTLRTFDMCLILIPATRSSGSASKYSLLRAFSGSSSSFPKAVLQPRHQYEGWRKAR